METYKKALREGIRYHNSLNPPDKVKVAEYERQLKEIEDSERLASISVFFKVKKTNVFIQGGIKKTNGSRCFGMGIVIKE